MKMDAEQLIECVRDFPLLYNLEEKEYCDTDKKERAWKEIGVLMNKSAIDCKKQWYNLRDCYRRAIKKRKDTRPGQEAKKIKRWKFEEEMSFLLPHLNPRGNTTTVNVDMSDNSDIGETEKNSPRSPVETDASDSNKPLPTPANSLTFKKCIPKENVPASRIMLRRQTASAIRLRRQHVSANKMRRPTASAIMMEYIIDHRMNERKSLDDIDQIFQGLAATVKKFSPYNQALAKAKVVSLVSDLEIEDLLEKKNDSVQGHNERGSSIQDIVRSELE
ncbi:uncharacterized protein [Halyomorpha halys]|uniref:uncharacterized protein n=1 Tax=Halyomorpha halys TaxID=286706 RepID=UPI0006D4C792|nr:uncharacterized protein LOC106677595 isoform X1 [Halyomorpha halys]